MTQTFVPGPDTSRHFRDALGCFSTGVTIVTCRSPEGPLGITVNSFAAVSLDPPLVLWSPAKDSDRYDAFMAAEHYAIHVIGSDQEALAMSFARKGAAFEGLEVSENDAGVPVLPQSLARFDCQIAARHDGGDHSILVGRVLLAQHRGGEPLLFVRGKFGRFMGVKDGG
ncbi:flavin reductase family protein [Poseidonocella sedimentorum]|uniref:NADH-FMN oxidoreductase RutF, flavin reductase (DIM6/NTAB) family n=1 Tax=Poseidonocella sedimentorum TaxID=871652 RepID=A0A1I6END3_9RHOB|nr:flavin reductase family protein [Poseidonocella sedimentorum]SFR19012.1 NADH-FMN oxidoreductase RutF, flavin reductase (DIM6/NTAB) family [Poseidonocella sedimentorum]